MSTNNISVHLDGGRSHGSELPVEGTIAVLVDHHEVALPDFLDRCAGSLRGDEADDGFETVRDRFLVGGLQALAATPDGAAWTQRGLRPSADPGTQRELCRRVAAFARDLLADGSADDVFFMHKPPGLRLRFRAAAGRRDLAPVVDAAVARWRADELVEAVEAGVYEPESGLFGGPVSMEFVHALFTVDSLVWLDYHACDDDVVAASPAWLVSLAVLAVLLDGLEITGWEDLGVWDEVRSRGGRRLEEGASGAPDYAQVADEIRDLWARRTLLAQLLHPEVAAIVDAHRDAVLEGAARWRAGYFGRAGAVLGPRAAAAMYVVFQWNRAGMSALDQALVAESLSSRGPS